MKFNFNKLLALSVFGLGVLITLVSFLSKKDIEEKEAIAVSNVDLEQKKPEKIFGFDKEKFNIHQGKIKKNQFLADILLKFHVSYPEIDKLVKKAKSTFDVRKIASGKNYTILYSKDSTQRAEYFIYEPNREQYVIFGINDTLPVELRQKEITVKEAQVSGEINSSLYEALTEAGATPALVMEMANIYAWTIDFYRIQKGDKFKVIYNNRYADDNYVGIGEIKAIWFEHKGQEFYAFHFEKDGKDDYFDENGNSLRKAFLKAPLKFSRITSRYTLKRFHPVQKRNKPHYGTDYAAATGTPIMAVGDGTVIESKYSKYNGNYVKIRHNGTYTTQYLHMNKRAVKKGQFVKQGQTIGYVGSTGLATGPHVCFRFWKNGKQVDHLKEKFPAATPVKKDYKDEFNKLKNTYKERLDNLGVEKPVTVMASL